MTIMYDFQHLEKKKTNPQLFFGRFYRQLLTVRLQQTGFHFQFSQETGSSEEVAAYSFRAHFLVHQCAPSFSTKG